MVAQIIMDHLSVEAKQILKLIEENKNFLLSGGAGSGKTYSLVEVISSLTATYPSAQIACITYTNAAVLEIVNRANHPNLHVSTIHDFLWDSIKGHQKELKELLLSLINDSDVTNFKVLDDQGNPQHLDSIDGAIRYKEYVKLREGIISHDEVISISNAMYSKYGKLRRILNDRYRFILVDEYQDTDPAVVEILLKHLSTVPRRNVIGFFGDAMQAIYDNVIGDLNIYIGDGADKVTEVKKLQNRRNPQKVIDLANKLRGDGFNQLPSKDIKAPNMNVNGSVKQGDIKFLYSQDNDIDKVKHFLGWDFNNTKATKELNLTHNLIASKAGFAELMRIYDGDQILSFVNRIKKFIKENTSDFVTEGKSFRQVLDELQRDKSGNELKKVTPTPSMDTYIQAYKDVYIKALDMPYLDLAKLYIDKDLLLDDKKSDQSELGMGGGNRDDLIKHLFKIQRNIQLYQEGKHNDFLRVTEYVVASQKDKLALRSKMDSLCMAEGKTINQIIEEADLSGIVKVDDRLLEFKHSRNYIFDQVANLPYKVFQDLYQYIEGFTPFSTQHKTKGREFDDILVILDNGNWNKYNFDYFFAGTPDKESVVNRTRKILYVCCTRAKENLALFYYQPSEKVLQMVQVLFGEENVINLDGTTDSSKVLVNA